MNGDAGPVGPSSCPWPWCASETVVEVGPLRTIVGHQSAPTRVHAPPDDLVVSLVAVDDEPPRVIVESVVDSATVPVIVLDVGPVVGLAAGLLASAGLATPVTPCER